MPTKLLLDEFHPDYFDVGSDIVVVGYNAENADFDNPRGAIHALRPYIRAVDEQGNTRVKYSTKTYHTSQEREAHADAEIVAATLNLKLAKRRKPRFEAWVVGRPVYGSPAYQDYGQADDLAWEKEHDEFGA
jgi:hypothetical protein